MSYTVQNINDAFSANVYEGVAVTNAVLCAWIDEAQAIIAKEYGPITQWAVANADCDTEYALPADCLKIAVVKRTDITERESYLDYMVTPYDTIQFEDDGDYNVVYHTAVDPITRANVNAVPEVHEIFHPAIHLYCLYRHWLKESESTPSEQAQARKFQEEFYQEVASSLKLLRDRERPARKIRRV